MATVTIRNLDDDIVERLRARARLNDRSLEAELRLLLAQASRAIDAAEFVDITDGIRRLSPSPIRSDTTAMLREARDR
jgi:plasmid stability protein